MIRLCLLDDCRFDLLCAIRMRTEKKKSDIWASVQGTYLGMHYAYTVCVKTEGGNLKAHISLIS